MIGERNIAYDDVRRIVNEYGQDVSILRDSETDMTRDQYGSITQRAPQVFKISAFPVRLNPSEKDLQKVGIREKVDLILYLSNERLAALGKTMDDIDPIRDTVQWKGKTYKITHRNPYSQFNDVDLYTVLGCVRT